VTALYQALLPRLAELGLARGESRLPAVATRHSTHQSPIVPGARVRYLADIADTVRGYKRHAREQARLAREIQQLRRELAHAAGGDPRQVQGAQALEEQAALREATLDPRAKEAARDVAADAASLCRRRIRG